MGVYATSRKQPGKMYGRFIFNRVIYGCLPNRNLGKTAVFNGKIDAREVLIHQQTGTDGCMPHLGIADFAPGNADSNTGGLQSRARIMQTDIAKVWYFSRGNGITLLF